MDGGAWWATVHGVAKSQTRLSDFTFTYLILYLIQFFKCSIFFLGEKLLFVKGAESSILPECIGGEIEKTRIHVDEFALVSENFSDFKNH